MSKTVLLRIIILYLQLSDMTHWEFSKDRLISGEFALFSVSRHFIDWKSIETESGEYGYQLKDFRKRI